MNRLLPAMAMTTLLFPLLLQAQMPAKTQTDLDSAAGAYYKLHPSELPIYNGRQHLGYLRSIIGDAYFLTRDWQSGSVLYEGVWYSGVPLKYDLSADELILQGANGSGSVIIRSRIQEFWLGENHFIRNPWDLKGARTFCRIITEGKMTLIAFYKKELEEKVLDREIERRFILSEQYLVLTDDGLHPIQRKKDLLRLLKEKRSPASAAMKAEDISYKADRERAMKFLVQFYNK